MQNVSPLAEQVLPARAGVIPAIKEYDEHVKSFTRTRGGDPVLAIAEQYKN